MGLEQDEFDYDDLNEVRNGENISIRLDQQALNRWRVSMLVPTVLLKCSPH